MSKNTALSKFVKAIINVFKEEKKPVKIKSASKKVVKPKKVKNSPKKPKNPPKEPPKKKMPANVQMPAPWSKVEKFKRIKKDSYF